jgi:hydroxyethylthiazole kinase-like uncharacterized protein yjeF
MSRRKLSQTDNKYSRGVVAVCAGSKKYPGAALLAVGGARRGNAGYVKYLNSDAELRKLIVGHYPDVVPITKLTNERVDSLVVGSGGATLAAIPDVPLVLDGSAIAKIKSQKKRSALTVITPHEGELKHLGINLAGSREAFAQKIARKFGVIVVLKGSGTVVADSNRIVVDSIGGPELATAGTGDVLAGLIGSFLAATKDRLDGFKLVCDAVTLHSKAGRQAAKKFTSVTALEVLEELRNV